tara:strand:+ start:1116 stop:2975 length:1860 start_codon:yes stop_codon:yes gene_type:complete
MCGIAGSIEPYGQNMLDYSKSGHIFKTISARGPDNYSISSEKLQHHKLTFAHTRLAIIDLSESSNQPFESSCGQFILTYNGEIYNFKELRDELKDIGYSFLTNGDAEVLINCWKCWGVSCLDKLNGMFAFAVYDRTQMELYLVRDRFGVKPILYGFLDNGGFIFSSSGAAIAKEINSEANIEYCALGFRYGFMDGHGSSSAYSSVSSVKAGHYHKISLAGNLISQKVEEWYNLPSRVANITDNISNDSLESLVDTCYELLSSATSLRLRSDVPVAVSLSGGVDSTSVGSIAVKNKIDLCGFTYGDPNFSKSEGPSVKNFASEVGLPVKYIWPNYTKSQLGDILEEAMIAQEAPLPGLSVLAQHEVYRSVSKNNYKVLLGGQGGDEVFAGYRKFFPVAIRNSIKTKDFRSTMSHLFSMSIMLLGEISNISTYLNESSRYLSISGNEPLLCKSFPDINENLFGSSESSLRNRQINDIQRFSLPTLLRFEDRNSMSFGIESRLPFLDYRLVEFGLALQDTLKIRNGYGKWILRKAMAGTVPQSILGKYSKRGFDVTQEWIKNGIGDRVIDLMMLNKGSLENRLDLNKNWEKDLSVEKLNKDPRLLSEAMFLLFIADPFKSIE